MSNAPPGRGHPLLTDPERLERIVDVMWAQIHKVLRRPPPSRRRSGGSDVARCVGEAATEQLLSGVSSPTDILSDALAALLATPEEALVGSWEAFAVGIARNKTKAALRGGQAGLAETSHRPEITVVSGNRAGPPDVDGEAAASLFDLLPNAARDLEVEFMATSQQVELIRLAREILEPRDRSIFLGLHFQVRSRTSLAEEFDLTPPGVTHVYRTIARRLYEHPRFQQYAEGGAP